MDPADAGAPSGSEREAERARLVRRYGFGVPDLDRARRSASNALTLIVQGSIRPFVDGKMREMHFFELPWPRESYRDSAKPPCDYA